MEKLKISFFFRRGGFILVFLLLFLSGGLSAQNNSSESDSDQDKGGEQQERIDLGIKFGTVLSQFSEEQPYTNVSQGIMGGCFLAYNFSNVFSLQIEGNYIQQGGRNNRFDIPAFQGLENWYQMKLENQEIIMHNIEVPLLAQFSIALKEGAFSLGVGPAFSYNLGTGTLTEGTVFASETNEFHTFKEEENISSVINSYEYSAIGSLKFEYLAFGNYSFFVEGRYKYGLSDVYEGYSYVRIPQIQADLKNHYMAFALGFSF
jgi:hypothetical protein